MSFNASHVTDDERRKWANDLDTKRKWGSSTEKMGDAFWDDAVQAIQTAIQCHSFKEALYQAGIISMAESLENREPTVHRVPRNIQQQVVTIATHQEMRQQGEESISIPHTTIIGKATTTRVTILSTATVHQIGHVFLDPKLISVSTIETLPEDARKWVWTMIARIINDELVDQKKHG